MWQKSLSLCLFVLVLLFGIQGCDAADGSAARGQNSDSSKPSEPQNAQPASMDARAASGDTSLPVPTGVSAPTGRVTRIVFIDQEECCDCTRERTDKTWTALENTLGADPIPVERIHLDSQADKAAPYVKKRALMVVPGVYFMDAQGEVVELLQGEVKEEQIAVLLSRSGVH